MAFYTFFSEYNYSDGTERYDFCYFPLFLGGREKKNEVAKIMI